MPVTAVPVLIRTGLAASVVAHLIVPHAVRVALISFRLKL